ncbi:MAG: thioesterase family protein [Thermoanaerobaculia bacterium]|jgi:YbgC/YbaW family acyl-CoA thioester hydrolase
MNPNPHRYSIEEYVRWEDIDAAGIINYQAYLRFFALAEAELFRHAGLTYSRLFDEIGIFLPRKRVECNFHVPVRLDDLLVVEAWIGHLGRSSLRIDFVVKKRDHEVVVADGCYVLVSVGHADFKKCDLPAELRLKLAQYMAP